MLCALDSVLVSGESGKCCGLFGKKKKKQGDIPADDPGTAEEPVSAQPEATKEMTAEK
jgi:hypothetical protein